MDIFIKGAQSAKTMLDEASSICVISVDNVKINKYSEFEPIAQHGSKAMSSFTKKARLTKMMLGEASSPFSYLWPDNVKMHKYTKCDPNVPFGSRVMGIFTKRA